MAFFRKRLPYSIIAILFVLLWQACKIVNPPEQDPTYIHIDSFTFQTNTSLKLPLPLLNTPKITCVWVYYNNQSVGVFDLPATFPVIASGTGTLEVFPGVQINGQNDLLAINPFYEADTFTFTAQPGTTIHHEGVTRYYTDIVSHHISDFSDAANDFQLDGGNLPIVSINDSQSIDGYYGRIYLGAIGDSSIDSNKQAFTIPTGSAFIQFEYKSTLPFYVGMQSHLDGVDGKVDYLTGIYPSSEWQTFYLSVQDFAAQTAGSTGTYNLFFKASTLPQGTTGEVLIDNVQLISY